MAQTGSEGCPGWLRCGSCRHCGWRHWQKSWGLARRPEQAKFSGRGRDHLGLSPQTQLPPSPICFPFAVPAAGAAAPCSTASAGPRRGSQAQARARVGLPGRYTGSRAPGTGGARPSSSVGGCRSSFLSLSKRDLSPRRSTNPPLRARSLRRPPARATSPPHRPPSCLPPQTTRPPAPCRPPPPRSTTQPATARSLPILMNGTFKIKFKKHRSKPYLRD